MRQGAAVPPERAKLTMFHPHAAIGLFGDGAGADLGLMHVQANDAGVDRGDVHGIHLKQQHYNG